MAFLNPWLLQTRYPREKVQTFSADPHPRTVAGWPLYALQLAQEKKVLNTSMDQIGASTLLMEAAATAVIDLQLTTEGIVHKPSTIEDFDLSLHPYPETSWTGYPVTWQRRQFLPEVWSIRQDALTSSETHLTMPPSTRDYSAVALHLPDSTSEHC